MIKANVRADESFFIFPEVNFLISWLFNRTARRFAGIDFMDLIPAPRVEHETGHDEGQVTLLIPRYSDPILGRIVQPRLSEGKKYIRLPLESRGALLWLHMDGKARVGDLVILLGENFADDQQDVAERLSGYLYALWENKFISFTNLPG
jgi:hypothetical protein